MATTSFHRADPTRYAHTDELAPCRRCLSAGAGAGLYSMLQTGKVRCGNEKLFRQSLAWFEPKSPEVSNLPFLLLLLPILQSLQEQLLFLITILHERVAFDGEMATSKGRRGISTFKWPSLLP